MGRAVRSRAYAEYCVLSAEEQQRLQGLMDRFRSFRHPSRDSEACREYERLLQQHQQRKMYAEMAAIDAAHYHSDDPSSAPQPTPLPSAPQPPQRPDDAQPPPAALLALLRETLDALRANRATNPSPEQRSAYWEWLAGQGLQDCMDEVLPAWMEPGARYSEPQQGWEAVEELLAAM